MENLKYVVDDSTLVKILGMQNFTTAESAILELVKNAYDAKALQLDLIFDGDSLEIIDSGEGMDLSDIKNHWMHIGNSSKKYSIYDDNNRIRIQAGSKGIGRFALSRLGDEVEVTSKKEGSAAIIWKTDWSSATVEESDQDIKCGTHIRINRLRDKWTEKHIEKLIEYIEVTYRDNAMKIFVSYGREQVEVKSHFPKPNPGVNCKSAIFLNYSKGKLRTEVKSNEFDKEAEIYYPDNSLYEYCIETDIYQELRTSDLGKLVGGELKEKLVELGEFSATFYFNVTPSKFDVEKFLYKTRKTPERVEGGIVLYRNAFSISSYEGRKDWIGLGKRARISTAAASHQTGLWRVRENQIAGFVCIDKEENKVLQDLANRQGLDENEYFQLFVKIIRLGIDGFERYRQEIIRNIDKKNNDNETIKTTILDRVLKKQVELQNLNQEDHKKLVSEIKYLKKNEINNKKEKEELEDRHRYDVRILNVLATVGLKASSIAHELGNNKSTLDNWYKYTIESLQEYGMWDELNSEKCTKYVYRNVPKLLADGNKVSHKIVQFMNVMLEKTEKKRFKNHIQRVKPRMDDLVKAWEKDYAWINIDVEVDSELEYDISDDLIQVVFDNLLLNSVQQNKDMSFLEIKICIDKIEDMLYVRYKDNGRGLDAKYEQNPKRILEVHETTREDGHGLGMWIVNNSCVMSGGEVSDIRSDNGFEIDFSIGGKR